SVGINVLTRDRNCRENEAKTDLSSPSPNGLKIIMLQPALSIQSASGTSSRADIRCDSLLNFDCSASFRELLLDALGFFLVDAFLDGLRSPTTQFFPLFQAGAGDFAYTFVDIDLFATNRGKDAGKSLLPLGTRCAPCRCSTTAGNHDWSSSRGRN